ncbi:MAG: hypothetical protein ACYC5Z_09305 [Acidimicrobiales bacterium]
MAAALAAMDHGLPVPDYRLYVPTVQTAMVSDVPTGFAEVAWAWFNEQYAESEPERRRKVEMMLRLHINPFFTQRRRNIGDVTSTDVSQFLRFLAGWGPNEEVSESPPTLLVARHYSLDEIAKFSGAHISAVKRASAEKKFADVVMESRRILVPAASVLAAGFGPGSHRQRTALPTVKSVKYAGEILVVLR